MSIRALAESYRVRAPGWAKGLDDAADKAGEPPLDPQVKADIQAKLAALASKPVVLVSKPVVP